MIISTIVVNKLEINKRALTYMVFWMNVLTLIFDK